jgi:hypothetical protein
VCPWARLVARTGCANPRHIPVSVLKRATSKSSLVRGEHHLQEKDLVSMCRCERHQRVAHSGAGAPGGRQVTQTWHCFPAIQCEWKMTYNCSDMS